MLKAVLAILMFTLCLASGSVFAGDKSQRLALKMLRPSIDSLSELNEQSNIVQQELPAKLKQQNWKHQISYEYRAATLDYEEFFKHRIGRGE